MSVASCSTLQDMLLTRSGNTLYLQSSCDLELEGSRGTSQLSDKESRSSKPKRGQGGFTWALRRTVGSLVSF